jgi:hypothetical protein
MNITIIATLLSLLVFLFVLELVRRHKLTFRYALAWLAVSVAAVFSAVFHEPLFALAAFFGFQLPSNFIFFMLSCAFVFLSLLLTVFLCQQHERNNAMAQKIALLEHALDKTKNQQT